MLYVLSAAEIDPMQFGRLLSQFSIEGECN